MSKTIQTRTGGVAIVDDDVFEWVSKWKWYTANGYVLRREFPSRRTIFLHREIMGEPAGKEIDHINQNKLDNRRENLRVCTRQQNASSKPKPNIKTISRFKGVQFQRGIWTARIKSHGVEHYLGSFVSEIDAAKAYDEAAKKYFGEFAYTNF